MFYDKFIRLCNSVGKSPTEVVLSIGLQRSIVTSWKNGRIPRDSTAMKLADYFGCTTDELFDKKNNISCEQKSPTNFAKQLLALFEQMNEEGQEKLLEIADDMVLSGKYKKSHTTRLDKKEA